MKEMTRTVLMLLLSNLLFSGVWAVDTRPELNVNNSKMPIDYLAGIDRLDGVKNPVLLMWIGILRVPTMCAAKPWK